MMVTTLHLIEPDRRPGDARMYIWVSKWVMIGSFPDDRFPNDTIGSEQINGYPNRLDRITRKEWDLFHSIAS